MMDLELEGRRALVTGATRGIGEATARLLAREGVAVVVTGRDAAAAASVADSIVANGGRASAVSGDLTDDDDVTRIVQAAGDVDVLVNNAGVFVHRTWQTLGPSDWLATYNANVVGMVRLIRALTPPMAVRAWGRVINVSSYGATMPAGVTMPDYSASKAAVVNMTVGLAKSLAGTGVTANAVSPGDVATPGAHRFNAAMMGRSPDEVEWGRDIAPWLLAGGSAKASGRVGTPEDVAALIAFLASPLASWINGTNVHIDGGTVPTVV